jgi:hypothetical protein
MSTRCRECILCRGNSTVTLRAAQWGVPDFVYDREGHGVRPGYQEWGTPGAPIAVALRSKTTIKISKKHEES